MNRSLCTGSNDISALADDFRLPGQARNGVPHDGSYLLLPLELQYHGSIRPRHAPTGNSAHQVLSAT